MMTSKSPESFLHLIETARNEGRLTLNEAEGMEILRKLGIAVPQTIVIPSSAEAVNLKLPLFEGEKAVVKVVSHQILHKSELGAVAIVPNRRETLLKTISEMEARLQGHYAIEGYSVSEFIPHEPGLGSEFLISLRFTEDFGPIVTIGAGGIHAEFLSKAFSPGNEIGLFSPSLCDRASLEAALSKLPATAIVCTSQRGQPPRVPVTELAAAIERFLEAAARHFPTPLAELEINPLVLARRPGATRGSPGSLEFVALDALVKLSPAQASAASLPRPVHKIRNLLEPKTIGIIGVSEKMNPGRTILKNLLAEGFDPSRVFIVKPGSTSIDGCQCVPDIASLPGTVDLFAVAVAAAQVPEVLTQVIQGKKAESLVVIPGGLEEKAGTADLVSRLRTTLAEARKSPDQGPVINGGNCLGLRSGPGKVNTVFIPEHKLPFRGLDEAPLALLSQSGAFAVSRSSKLGALQPRYTITMGNQMDLTVGDVLTYLKDDPKVRVFAVYVEGFRPLDGLRFLEAARAITESGRTVVLYRAGRTAEGAAASASHTASIAGQYTVTRELARAAGVVLAESIEDFEDLTRLFTALDGVPVPRGRRLGAISNAGFECVAFADNLAGLKLIPYEGALAARLHTALREAGVDGIVDVHNPLDLTPMTADAGYEAAVAAILEAPEVDVAMVGCVPLTPALQTLAAAPGVHREDIASLEGLAQRLVRVRAASIKPWVAVVDSGELYDPFARALERARIPVFRAADRATRLLSVYCGRFLTRS